MDSIYCANDSTSSTRNIGGGRPHIHVSVYCNASGLMDVLSRQGICDRETFHKFCIGFNQAAPMISLVDAGSGKGAADSKIKGSSTSIP